MQLNQQRFSFIKKMLLPAIFYNNLKNNQIPKNTSLIQLCEAKKCDNKCGLIKTVTPPLLCRIILNASYPTSKFHTTRSIQCLVSVKLVPPLPPPSSLDLI